MSRLEKITFACPPELARWLRREARRRHRTLSGAVAAALEAAKDAASLEQAVKASYAAAVSARAALYALADAYARGDAGKAADYSRKQLARAQAALRRAGLEPLGTEDGEEATGDGEGGED